MAISIHGRAFRSLEVLTPFPCPCDWRFPCKCLTFMAAIEEANRCEDVGEILVHEGTHKATGRQWIGRPLTIRSVAKRGQSTPVIEGARLMVCNGDPHKVFIQGLVFHAEQNDYAVDIS